MDENKSVKISLGIIILIFIILILIIALILVYYFGFVADKNEVEPSNNTTLLDTNINNSNENITNDNTIDNTINFEPSKYVMQLDAELLEGIYEPYGNEFTEWNREISFLKDNTINIYMGEGISIQGTYTVSNDIINCTITSTSGEYSPAQEITGKISFRIISNSEIEIIDVPESYTIKVSELTDSGWVLTDETTEISFVPLVEGIKFIAE